MKKLARGCNSVTHLGHPFLNSFHMMQSQGVLWAPEEFAQIEEKDLAFQTEVYDYERPSKDRQLNQRINRNHDSGMKMVRFH